MIETVKKKKNKKVVKMSLEEQGQVIVHCHYKSLADMSIRIWKTTYLICNQSGKKRKMLHAENIANHPHWTFVKGNMNHTFTLIFSMLPKSCDSFDLMEQIPEPGGFKVIGILRNKEDVYHVRLS